MSLPKWIAERNIPRQSIHSIDGLLHHKEQVRSVVMQFRNMPNPEFDDASKPSSKSNWWNY